jgi:putative FmdB family regulatory protein
VPIYEYKCENGHVFDVMQRISDDPLTECQECGAPAQRVLHPVAVHFKGSGFYNTSESGSPSESKPKSDSGSKSDSKATASTAD